MRLALIGCGAVAAKHAQAIAQDANAQLTWLCDVRSDAAAAMARRYAPTAQIANSFDAIPLEELDGVVICSPTAEHYHQVATALRGRKHVLSEKPLAANSEQIRELIKLRDSVRCQLSVAFQRRTEAPYMSVRNLISASQAEFGTLKTMHLFVCERWKQTIEGTWRDDPKLGFGYFGDAGVHQIDSIAFMTGATPLRVQARSDRRSRNVEIVTDVRSEWRIDGGKEIPMTAQFVGDANHWREDIALHFENADVLLRNGEIQVCQANQCERITTLAQERSPIADFLETCRGRGNSVAPAECGLVSALWTEAVLASISSGESRLL